MKILNLNLMYKIKQKKENINPFGGIYFIARSLKEYGIAAMIDEHMGNRPSQATYKYSDVILGVSYSHFCGGSFLDDMNVLRKHFNGNPQINFCSPDTVEYVCNQLKEPTTEVRSKYGVMHEFNRPNKLNRLLIKTSVKTKQLKRGRSYNLDYDNVITPNEKYDCKRTYKKNNGYQPGVAFIGKLPVYIEGRNGNSPAKYKMDETFDNMFSLLEESKIKIENFRSDCAAYQESVINKVEEHCNNFYIRIMDSQELMMQVRNVKEWTKVEINYEIYDVASIDYCPFGKDKTYRVVIQRREKKDKQTDLFLEGAYNYAGIITSDYQKTDEEVIIFYNQRASLEPNFHYLNEDFNWQHMPFSFLDQNTVYMVIAAISFILFEFIKGLYCKMVDFVEPSMRMKRFILNFVALPSKWIHSGREWILKIFSEKDFKQLLC